jgi:hypothetical protein
MYVAYMAFPVGVIIAFIYPLFEMIGFRRWLLNGDVGSDPQRMANVAIKRGPYLCENCEMFGESQM